MENIELLNNSLRDLDDQLTQQFDTPSFPIVAIVGAPRGGKSYLQQLLLSVTDIGYVSNIQAKFYLAPYIGALAEQEILDRNYASNFEAFYGVTEGPNEPHEWGWFWKHFLNVSPANYFVDESRTDLGKLVSKLAALVAAKQRPFLFQNIFATTNLPLLKKCIPNLIVIHMLRNPLYLINSYLKTKEETKNHEFAKAQKGNYGETVFFEPPGFKYETSAHHVDKIAALVKATLDFIDSQVRIFDKADLITVDYDDAKEFPQKNARRIVEFVNGHGGNVSLKAENFERFKTFPTRNRPERISKEFFEEIHQYFQKYFS